MPKRHIGTKLTIDGEREYKASVQSINASLRTLNTQMAAVSAKYKENSDSVEALNAKSSILNQQYAEQVKKLETLEKAHKNAADQKGKDDKRTQKWAQSVNIAKKRLSELERQIGEVERELDPLNRAIKENEEAAQNSSYKIENLNSELKALDAQYANNKDSAEYLAKKQKILDSQYNESVNRVKALENALKSVEQQSGRNSEEYIRMESSLNGARAEMYSAENATSDLTSQSRGLGDEINDVASKFGIQLPEGITSAMNSFGKFDKKSDGTATKSVANMDSIKSSVGGISFAAAGVATAIAGIAIKAIETAIEIEDSTARMKVALNLVGPAAEAAEDAVTDVYVNAIVENRGEAEAAVVAVMKDMDATGDHASSLADKLVVIKEVFGKDYVETAGAAETMMKNFGITGGEALDIIVAGLQTSADKKGDLLDTFNDYSNEYKDLGDDAVTFLSRIVAGVDAGAESADKAADTYKEFFNYATDGSEEFKKALEALGFSSDSIIYDIKSGGEVASDALNNVVIRLEGIIDTAEQKDIAKALFGSKWEDVGTEPILAMNKVENKIIDTNDAAGKALDIMLERSKRSWQGFWRWWNSFEPVGKQNFQKRVEETGADTGEALIDGYINGMKAKKQEAIDVAVQTAEEIAEAADNVLNNNGVMGVTANGNSSVNDYTASIQNAVALAQRETETIMRTVNNRGIPQGGVGVGSAVHTQQPVVIHQHYEFHDYTSRDGAAAVRDLNRQLGLIYKGG